MKVLLTWDNSTFRERNPLRICPSFNRFLHCGSKVFSLGIVQSTKCFVFKWETACFCILIQTLSTSSFASLNVTFFLRFWNTQCAFEIKYLFQKRIAYFKSVIKISKGFKKWNCFRKSSLNTSLIVSIVRTATSVTKIISRKYKFHVAKRKMQISFRFAWGEGGGNIFAGYVPLASQSSYPIIVFSMANYRPHWVCKCNFRDPNLVTFYLFTYLINPLNR